MFNSVYISKNLPLPSEQAGPVVDRWHGRLDKACPWLSFRRGGRRLWLTPTLSGPRSDPFTLRRGRGIAWVGCRPVRVEFELVSLPGAPSVALFPRSLSPVTESRRYETTIRGALEEIVRALSATVAASPTHPTTVPAPAGTREAA